jgi:hypothetical protein
MANNYVEIRKTAASELPEAAVLFDLTWSV